MTEKRFTIEQTMTRECIVDNTTGEQLDSIDYTERLCGVLNALYEENQRLKKAEILANHRGEMISFATALIEDLGSETMKEMWDKFREEKYEEWRNLE